MRVGSGGQLVEERSCQWKAAAMREGTGRRPRGLESPCVWAVVREVFRGALQLWLLVSSDGSYFVERLIGLRVN